MSTSIHRVSPAGLAAIFTALNSTPGVPSVASCHDCQVKAMLLMSNNDLGSGSNWDNFLTLNGYSGTLDEFNVGTTTYYRKEVDFNSLGTTGGQVFFQIHDPVWSALPAATRLPTHILYYIELSGAATDASATPPPLTDRIPLCVVDASFTPDGTDFTALQPTNGMFRVTT